MNQEHQLLKAIFDNPTEDTPRLAYADWLDSDKSDITQANRDRAEFIRTQIALERGTDPITGGPLSVDRRNELSSRETELQKAMIDALGPEIAAAIAHDPQRISFDRGFLQNLNLSETQITQLPEELHVGGHLDLGGTMITELPEGLHVGGDLNLYGTGITQLPEGLHVGGNLNLYGTPIAYLPEGLHVGGYLDLFRTQITQLPEGLHVGANLSLGYTPITELPEELHVGGHLDLGGTPIAYLPEGLHVGGHLNLYGTGITREAALRIAGMPGLSASAKISGLHSAGFDFMADQVAQDAQNRYDGRQ